MSAEGSSTAQANAGVRELARSIVAAADGAGVLVRVIGGIAVSMHSPSSGNGPLARPHEDIDLVIHRGARGKIDRVLESVGAEGDRRFNALNGADRRLYQMHDGLKLDVFVGEFRMCHTIPLDEERLSLDHPTAPLAELLVTKAQIVHLTSKDATDVIALLADHEVGTSDADTINGARIAELCSRDWGLWRTMQQSLERVLGTLPHVDGLGEAARGAVRSRLEVLRGQIEAAPKSSKWKMRARVGDRKVWYELPEDPRRDGGAAAE